MFTAEAKAVNLKAKLFRGFADSSRLRIIEALRDGPLTVGAIVEETNLSQSNSSNHLRCLADCGLVISERDGRYVRYELSDPRVAEFVNLADELIAEVARGIYNCTRYRADIVDNEEVAA